MKSSWKAGKGREDAAAEAETSRLRASMLELERLNASLNAELSHLMRENLSLCREVERLPLSF